MCTYSISVDDELLEKVKPAFCSNEALGKWMQTQMDYMLRQLSVSEYAELNDGANSLFGSWIDNRSAEEIVEDIRSSRKGRTRDIVELFS